MCLIVGGGSQDAQHYLQDAALRAAANAIVFTDRQGVILWVNPAFTTLTGYTAEEVVGRNPRVLKSGVQSPEVYRDMWRTILSGQAWHGEVTNRHKNGSLYVEEMTITPVRDADGEISHFIAIKQDVTPRKEAEEALRRANEELLAADHHKDEFLAMLGHELRNPLAAIMNATSLMQIRGTADPTTRSASDLVMRQAQHMARLLDDLLDVARVTRGKIALRKERVELQAVVGRAVQSVRHLVASRGHDLSLSLPPEPLHLDADPDRLQQIVSNLLANAAKYTDPGGRISVAAWRDGDDALVEVGDNGMGIAPDLLPHVFDVFVQAEPAADRSLGGLGIGLTMVRRLVEMHGGTVEAQSEGVGKGCIVRVRLPALPASPSSATAPSAAESEGESARLLLVDDNEDAAEMLAQLLELEGHKVMVAHTGPAAIQSVSEYHPDTILLDIGLPGMDGFEVARHLRERGELTRTALIALTGYGQEQDRQRAREAGFHRYLTKPVNLKELRRVLAEVLGRRSPTAGAA